MNAATRRHLELDTRVDDRQSGRIVRGGDAYPLEAREMAVFRLRDARRRTASTSRRPRVARAASAPA